MAHGTQDWWGAETADIVAQTLANLKVDITAQTIAELAIKTTGATKLAMDIAAQTLSALNINITAQDLAQLVIKIAAQSVGVYLQPEWAALQGTDKDFYEVFKNIPAGARWVSPTGYNDPDTCWDTEANIYDEDTITYASTSLISVNLYSGFLELTHPAIICDKIRFWVYQYVARLTYDFDVYYGGAWHDVYEGLPAGGAWEEKELGGEYEVTKARVRVKSNNDSTMNPHLYEFDFCQIDYTSYPVPAGKTLYLTQIGFSISGSADADKDKDQMGWVRIFDATSQSSKLEMGGNGGNFVSLDKPIRIDAEHEVRFYWYNRTNHTCDGSISVDGYEI